MKIQAHTHTPMEMGVIIFDTALWLQKAFQDISMNVLLI